MPPSGRRPPGLSPSRELAGELAAALTALDSLDEGGLLNRAELGSLVADAVLATYRRLGGEDSTVRAHVDLDRAGFELLGRGADGEIRAVDPGHSDFVRQAAEAARVAVAGRIREAMRESVVREFSGRTGELVDSLVEHHAGDRWHLTVEGRQAVLPFAEQIAGEELRLHAHLKVVVIDVRLRVKDAQVIVSRTDPRLVARLLEREVPELVSGQVEIRGIAREPGRRCKVAVWAPRGGVDAPGACIGPKGVRHRAVVSELGGEQVQIIPWSEDPAAFVADALTPATIRGVELDQATRTAHVAVPADQLSLAIGRSGENARLTARLTGWRIDIRAAAA
ncbi:MAG: transcription termination/antitermination protein NusA [Candidatus Dormibacteria bacterium]